MKSFFLLLIILLHSVASSFAQDDSNYYEAALQAINNNNENEAYIQVKNSLQVNPKHLPSKILLSQLYFAANNLEAAESELEEALDMGADINLLLGPLGTTLLLQNKVEELLALEKHQRSFSQRATFEWLLLKGQVHIRQQQSEAGLALFNKAKAMYPDDVRALNTLASTYLSVSNPDAAHKLAQQSITLNSENEKTWQLLGKIKQHKGDDQSALLDYLSAHALDPSDPVILRSLAKLYLKLGLYGEAKKYVDLILDHSPNDPVANLTNAWIMLANNDTQQARTVLAELSDRLATLDNKQLAENSSLLFAQGMSEYLLGNLEKAQRQLTLYLKAKPADAGATRLLLDIYLQTGNTGRAISFLETYQNQGHKDFGLSVSLIQLYIDSDQLFNASQGLQHLSQNFPENPFSVQLMAQLEKKRGRLVQAYTLLTEQRPNPAPLSYDLLTGEVALRLGRTADASALASKLIKDHPNNPTVMNFMASTYMRGKQFDQALHLLNEILAHNPSDSPARFNKAIALTSMRLEDAAREQLLQIIDADQYHENALLLLARSEAKQRKYTLAMSRLEKILSRDPANTLALEQKLMLLTTQNKLNEALRIARQLNSKDRLNSRYLKTYADLLLTTDKPQEAVGPLNILSGVWSKQPDKLRQLAAMQLRAGLPQQARESLNKSLQLNPNGLQTKMAIARLELAEGRPDSVAIAITNIESNHGENSALEQLKGDLAMSRGHKDLAQKHYYRSVKMNTDNNEAIVHLYQLSRQQIGTGQFTRLMESLASTPGKPIWMKKLLADSYLVQQDWDKAQKLYEEITQIPHFAKDPAILNNLANIYSRFDIPLALVTAKQGLGEVNSAALLDTIGWLLAKQGDFNDALSYLREAYSMNSANPEIRYHLGYTLHKLNRTSEAVVELKAALQSNHKFAEITEAKRILQSISEG